MGRPDTASSGVVRPSRSLAARVVVLACVLSTFGGLVASVGACKRKPDAVAEAVGHFRGRPALGFSDCLVLASARKAGHLPLGTFDRGLAKLDGALKP